MLQGNRCLFNHSQLLCCSPTSASIKCPSACKENRFLVARLGKLPHAVTVVSFQLYTALYPFYLTTSPDLCCHTPAIKLMQCAPNLIQMLFLSCSTLFSYPHPVFIIRKSSLHTSPSTAPLPTCILLSSCHPFSNHPLRLQFLSITHLHPAFPRCPHCCGFIVAPRCLASPRR